jgi:flagellar basal-body rod protein FlgF
MDRLIWTAVSGMSASMARQRMIASNMANAQTIGFRAETMQFTPVTLKGPSLEARALSDAEVRGARMEAGSLVQTGRPLDVALQGQALLAVQGEDGSETYTRRGDLSLTPAGLLVNGEGRPVLGEGGPVSVPPGSDVSLAPDGAVLVRDRATPDAPLAQVEKLKLASPVGSRIGKALDGLFRVAGGGVLPADPEARLASGTLEQSNVRPSEVLVEMVEAQRLYDMRTKLVATAKELDEGGASLMRLS